MDCCATAGEILADADLFYMGTADYDMNAEKLYREISFSRPGFSRSEWPQMQMDFLQNHLYHTAYGQNVLEPEKKKHLALLIGKQEQKRGKDEGFRDESIMGKYA